MKKISESTKSIHGENFFRLEDPVATPIYQTSTFRFENSNDALRFSKGDSSVYVYSRYHNPSVEDVEEKSLYYMTPMVQFYFLPEWVRFLR